MSGWDGAGNFGLIYNWVTDAGNDIKIRSDRMQAENDGIATGLENCMTITGETTPTANIPFGGYKITGIANGTAATDGMAVGQAVSGALTYYADSGSADTYAITPSPAITAYAAGQRFSFLAGNANTGASTLNANGLGAKNIKKFSRTAIADLASGDIVANAILDVIYDGTQFLLTGGYVPLPTLAQLGAAATGAANTFSGVNTHSAQVRWAKGSDVASGSALTLGTDGNYFDITGTTTITSIGALGVGTVVRLHFDGALTLTHHATDLILPGVANITTAAGDEATFVEYASGDWRCTSYQIAANAPGETGGLTLGTEQATTSGTSIDFTGIPSGTREIRVMLDAVSGNGTSNPIIQLGDSGGIETSGYSGAVGYVTSGNTAHSGGFLVTTASDANSTYHGVAVLTLEDATNNVWSLIGAFSRSDAAVSMVASGTKALSATLDRIRLTFANGTDTFDAGAVNIIYQ